MSTQHNARRVHNAKRQLVGAPACALGHCAHTSSCGRSSDDADLRLERAGQQPTRESPTVELSRATELEHARRRPQSADFTTMELALALTLAAADLELARARARTK